MTGSMHESISFFVFFRLYFLHFRKGSVNITYHNA